MNSSTDIRGWHIALFIFALSMVGIPLSRKVFTWLGPGWEEKQIFRFVVLSLALALIVAFPMVRQRAIGWIRTPVPLGRRNELAFVVAFNVFMPFAFAAAMATWWLLRDGVHGPEALIAAQQPREQQIAWAFSRSGMFILFAGALAAPVMEELVFRGFLFQAWAERWGWRWSAVLTSAMFAFYHPHFIASFVESLIFIFVLRRTGALAAPIAVHAVYNLALWPPLMGQFIYPLPAGDPLIKWTPQFAAFLAAIGLTPAYAWLAHRTPADRQATRENPFAK